MSNASVSRRFGDFIRAFSLRDASPDLLLQAKLRVLDSLATAITARELPVPKVAIKLVAGNSGSATIVGQQRTFPAVDAAFVNATLINAGSQDDFLQKSHPGAIVVAAALAAAEDSGATGADLLAAVIVGYEIIGRVYLGGPGMLPRFRATGVAGTVAAAAAAAKVLRLDAEQTAHALGCAAVFASGFGAGFLSGTMDVKLNVGMACRNGLSAALLARAGATASDLAFEGESGFYLAVAGTTEKVDAATAGLGERFLLEDTIYKELPVCIFVQTPMIVAREIAGELRCPPDQIQAVRISVPEPTYSNPGFRNVAPFRSALNARVSVRFCVAATLLGKPIDDHEFYEEFHDPEVLALAERIEVEVDQSCPDRVAVQVDCGSETLSREAAEDALLVPTREKIVSKYRRLATPRLNGRTEPVMDGVFALDRLSSIADLAAMLRN